MVPAEQRLVARDLMRAEVDQGLVVEGELAELDRLTELDESPRSLHGRGVEVRLEEGVSEVLMSLGAVHRRIRLLEHRLDIAAD